MEHEKIPLHIALIPDGNRRWAKERGLKGTKGHEEAVGKERTIALFEEAQRLGVKYFTIWGFSTENWRRGETEKKFLFNLIFDWLNNLRDYAHKNGIRFKHIGRKDRIPGFLIKGIEKFEEETENNSNFYFQLCLDYGGRDEIVRAVNNIVARVGHLGDIDEKQFSNFLDTKYIPEPDLIIRTGGEKRLSGFMAYQSTYAELYFTDLYFPDFGTEQLREAIEDFSNRKRRFGGD